jgi:hypothetical protein
VIREYRSGEALGDLACGAHSLWVSDPERDAVFRLSLGRLHYIMGVTIVDEVSSIAFGRGALWILDGSQNTLVGVTPSDHKLGPFDVAPGATQIIFVAPDLWILHFAQSCLRHFSFDDDAETGDGVPTGPDPQTLSASDGHIYVPDYVQGSILSLDTVAGRAVSTPVVIGQGHMRISAVSEFDGRLLATDTGNGDAVYLSAEAQAARLASHQYAFTQDCSVTAAP